jgi:pimeloyl-ACP methyl ester carboxylesterase
MPTVQSAGVPIYYEQIGVGSPILLVHGFASSFEGTWGQSGWIAFLLAQGCQVVGMDCRGHGRSGKPHDPAAYDYPRMPDDVLAVMDAAGLEHVDLMGYSSGGAIAIALLAFHPDRFRSVIVGGAGQVTPAIPQVLPDIAAALETDDLSAIKNPAALFFRQFAESRAHDPHSIAQLNPDLHALAALCKAGLGLRSTHEDVEAALGQVRVPLLAVAGDKDAALPGVRRLSQTVPNAQFVMLPGEDHFSAIPAQTYKEAVASFLKEHSFSAA